MAAQGVIFKRCGCRDRSTGRRVGRGCIRLGDRYHGSWYFHCSATDLCGRADGSAAAATRRRPPPPGPRRRAGAAARGPRRRPGPWSSGCGTGSPPAPPSGPTRCCSTPATSNTYLIPHLGRVRLSDLTSRHIAAMLADLEQAGSRRGTPLAAGTLHRARATLRAALNAAIRDGLITANPARLIEVRPAEPPAPGGLDPAPRRRLAPDGDASRRRGVDRRQTAEFLDHVTNDRLLRHVVADRAPRPPPRRSRRTALGRRRPGPPASSPSTQQLTTPDQVLVAGEPKSRRQPARHRPGPPHRRNPARPRPPPSGSKRITAGDGWHDTGYVFTRPDGQPIRPELRSPTGSGDSSSAPACRRSGSTTCGTAPRASPTSAGADLKTVQDQLGHASIVAHRRHLHQRPTRQPIQGRRRHRATHTHRRPCRPRQPPHPTRTASCPAKR